MVLKEEYYSYINQREELIMNLVVLAETIREDTLAVELAKKRLFQAESMLRVHETAFERAVFVPINSLESKDAPKTMTKNLVQERVYITFENREETGLKVGDTIVVEGWGYYNETMEEEFPLEENTEYKVTDVDNEDSAGYIRVEGSTEWVDFDETEYESIKAYIK